MIRSQIDPLLTIEYMTNAVEGKHFDRKSAKKKPSDLASLVSAFANADGGTIAIGFDDKTKLVEGFNGYDEDRMNQFIVVPKEYCRPMPKYEDEILEVDNMKGEKDKVLLLHIFPSLDQIIRTSNDSTYLRIGDQTKELKGEDLRNLEYSKNVRHYEDEINYDAEIEDLDKDLLKKYKKRIGAEDLDDIQVLRSRGFLKKKDGKQYLTNAGVLLFAENILQFYSNCRVRFLRYEGVTAKTGKEYNVIKDKSIDEPILKLVDESKKFIESQLRDFTALDNTSGKFKTVPEYPEFAWFEGIVNAICHRSYAMTGAYIKVAMYDDRLEITSPGGLPNIVTVDNIKETRFSTNTKIARVMTEFGWVRELNEGVKRIYSEMEGFFLEDPVYAEDDNGVTLTLKNNIVMRKMRQEDRVVANIGDDTWKNLDDLSKEILNYMSNRKAVTRSELAVVTGKSISTMRVRLNKLMELNIVKRNGTTNDPNQTYEML